MTLETRDLILDAGKTEGTTRNQHRAASRQGFTLVETSIVIALTVFELAALTNLYILFNSTYGYEEASIATAGSSSAAMSAFGEAVLPARRILSSRDFTGTVYESAAATLVLEVPAVDSAGGLIPDTYDHIAFYTSGNSLYRLTESAPGSIRRSGLTLLSSTLASLSFAYDNPAVESSTSVAADLSTRAQFKQQAVESRLSGIWYLRNLP
ncbi:hypothetical protein HYV30_02520 [Candidatus Kaiserbacteria bacterium]|nr:hypothetical protein [Candidatus Kaiserbacteria bacterium]